MKATVQIKTQIHLARKGQHACMLTVGIKQLLDQRGSNHLSPPPLF